MASTFLTVEAIARESLMVLYNYLTIGRMVYKDMRQEFTGNEKRGDFVNVRRPANYQVYRHGIDPYTVQSPNESAIQMRLEEHFTVDVGITNRDLTLSLSSFSDQVIAPVVRPMAESMDDYFLSKFTHLGSHVGTAGSPPATLAAVVDIDKQLNIQRVPRAGRVQFNDPLANAKLLSIGDPFIRADTRGDSGNALESAEVGQVMNLTHYISQGIPTHTAGTAAGEALVVNGNFLRGATTIALDGGTATETLLEGDPIMIGDYGYVVAADATASGGAFASVTLKTPLIEDIADNTAIVPTPATHKVNAAFHPNAFGLAVVPLQRPMSNVRSEVVSFEGLSMRVTFDYDPSSRSDVISFDVLVGAQCIQPELGVRVLG